MQRILITGVGRPMYVNPADLKGRSLIRRAGVSQPRIVHFWQCAASGLQPSVVIDGGVNYGEIVLSAEYPPHADVTVVEANEELRPYLARSLREHPNAGQIREVYACLSDREDESGIFYIDTSRSGDSSAYEPVSRPVRAVHVRTVTIDGLFRSRDLSRDTVLFKLDIEGFEWQALRGMSRLLRECRAAAGCIEFNVRYMEQKGGIDVQAFLADLHKRFSLYLINDKHQLLKLEAPLLQRITDYYATDPACNDLVLLSDSALAERIKLEVV